MRYFFSINDKAFENVSKVETKPDYRSEVSKTNLGGDLLIDRTGDEKTELTVKTNMLSAEDMEFLRSSRRKMSVSVSYYEGNTLKNKTMYINPFTEPSPIYFYGDREKGLVYPTVTLKLSEI